MQAYTQKSQEVLFHHHPIRSDLYRYIDRENVLVLLNRLPLTEYGHLRTVTFKTCYGANAFGRVFHRRITGIVICDLARRLSIRLPDALRGHLDEYGALPNMKWPTLAVRRFQLYNTFLHELRHTQVVTSGKERTRDRIPLEKLAMEYAEHWRGELYRDYFDHPDPVHNLPSATEQEHLLTYWPQAMAFLQEAIRFQSRRDYKAAQEAMEQCREQMMRYLGDWCLVRADLAKVDRDIERLRVKAAD